MTQKDVEQSRHQRPIVNNALWIVQGLLALLFLGIGGGKLLLPIDMLTAQLPVPVTGSFVRFLGVAEVLGALGLILPGALHIWVGLTRLAAGGLVLIMTGATILTFTGSGGLPVLVPLTAGLLAAFVVFGRWRLQPLSDTPQDPDATHDRAGDRDTLNTDVMQWVSALAALVGLWIVASPFIYEAMDVAFWNNTIVGTGIFLLAAYNFYRLSKDQLASVDVAAMAILLGLWIAVSPYFIEMGSNELATSTMISGIIVALLSAYNAYINSKADTPEHTGTRA